MLLKSKRKANLNCIPKKQTAVDQLPITNTQTKLLPT